MPFELSMKAVVEHSLLEQLTDDHSSNDYLAWGMERVVEEVAAGLAQFFVSKLASLLDWNLLLRPNRNTSIHSDHYTNP